MKIKLSRFFSLSKRQKFVVSITILTAGVFLSEFFSGVELSIFAIVLSFLTVILLYVSLREDIRGTFHYPLFVLPAFYTLSVVLFHPLVPDRLLTRIVLISVYALGLYSLFLTQNIFAVSAIRTITLMRSARIVSFVLTIVVVFLLTSIIFSLRFPIYISTFLIFVIAMLLNFQSLWTYSLTRDFLGPGLIFSAVISLALTELSLVLILWPLTAAIYSIFLTGIFYAYSGLSHAWMEKRLFRGVLWEYVWVGFLAVLILIFFSRWGI